MMTVAAYRRVLWAWIAGVACAAGGALAAEPGTRTVVLDVANGWQASFDAKTSVLECRHGPSGTTLAGPLSFAGQLRGKSTTWTICPARDATPRRLVLVDGRNDVQGYVVIVGDGLRLSLTAIHRPPHRDAGTLTFAPEITFGREAFACRTRVDSETPVVQMASGPADSLLNDSLFDAHRDLLMRFDGKDVALSTATAAAAPDAALKFHALLRVQVAKSDAATVTVELSPDYYRSRYAPRYRLIDRKRCPKAPTGWMAWNVYFDAATENDDLAEARVAAKHLKQFGLEFWSIESWQDNSPKLPVSNFHNLTMRPSPEKFPHGMKWLAEQIRALGFRPGIWTVSFGTGDEKFYNAHRDWFLHDRDGRPMKNWNGRFVLDPSQAAVRQYTAQTHRQMAQEWGYEFFKSDGMSGSQSSYSAHFFERPEVQAAFREPCADPYGMWVEALRRGIGPDRVLLACQGHYTGPDPAVADATRIGGDLVHFPEKPHWRDYLNQARATQSQLFTNNLLWYNDPDTLMVGEHAPMSVARIATTVVALPGQLTFFGDQLTRLPADRMRLLQQALPVCDVRPMDLLPLDELKSVWDLKIRRPFARWDVVSMFNWEDAPATQRVTFAQLGLDASQEYLVYEFWSHKFLGVRKEFIELPVEPHTNVLLAVHPRSDRPQLLSTDRHVSQGGVELVDMAWNPQRAELVCTFDLVAGDPLTACYYVPKSFRFVGAGAAEAKLERVAEGTDATILATIRRDLPGKAELRLKFRPAN
jgi:hypothetical protein